MSDFEYELPDLSTADRAEAEAMFLDLVDTITVAAGEFLERNPDTTDAVRHFGVALYEQDDFMGMLEDKMLIAGLGIHIYMLRNMPKE